ncbi:MAG: hypothetical protein GWM90_00045 [Gemmatimonadetes bacterium]|nr:hypothetical protein [Gemmatimonadota bacterium]NIQ51908.1 hypothetical protein [Gemmatimonadota bacterium]NIU72015.1 hypothetical protein [Gammaproteobacteria bacterium]NIX42581.1 hypothetical protein [Gemmatimonadota bacterium]NIY06756.1 hypothetical protein [Gemmatimonadota bacterium]
MPTGRALRLAAAVAAALAAGSTPDPLASQSTHVVVVTGLGGGAEFSRRFAGWGAGLVDAAVAAGVPRGQVTWLAEDEAADPRVTGVARKEGVGATLAALADRAGPDDLILVAIFGHGSDRAGEGRINLPGPDLSAGELAVMLDPLAPRRLVVVNAASASGGFIGSLSAPGRVVITATRSGRQNEATRFGGHFVDALAGGADTDKDGRVSMLEAFEFARLEVAREYERAGQLATENALLDDNGDGRGSLEPGGEDGSLAASLALGSAGPGAAGGVAVDSLRAEQARLRTALDSLRAREETMEPDAYRAELERLLLEIARVGRAIRERGGAEDGGAHEG